MRMNLLKRKPDLRNVQKLPALPKPEICGFLQPFAVTLGLTFTDNEVRFPQPLCFEQRAVHASAYCETLYPECIPYDDIVIMEYDGNKLQMILRNGHIFHFVADSRLWLVSSTMKYGEPLLITVWWWMFSGWITLLWWKLTGRYKNAIR